MVGSGETGKCRVEEKVNRVGLRSTMTLGVCECEEHLVAVPVEDGQKSSLDLDEHESNDSKEMIKYVAPQPNARM